MNDVMKNPAFESVVDALLGVQFALSAHVYQQTGLALEELTILNDALSDTPSPSSAARSSEVVAGLIEKGLLENVFVGQHQWHYRPSLKGYELLRRAGTIAATALSSIIQELTEKECLILRKLVQQVRD
jgi:hypothetical protein